MPNTEALVATFEHILKHPKDWNQAKWVCGTSYCYAGTAAVHIFGATLDVNEEVTLNHRLADVLNANDVDDEARIKVLGSVQPWQAGDRMHVSNFAAAALGLIDYQAEDLFAAINGLADLKLEIESITGIKLPDV